MEIHVSRMLFANSDENNPHVLNKSARFSISLAVNEAITPKAKHLAEVPLSRGDLSTPRPRKERSPLALAGEEDGVCTPPEPNAPVKDKCKSDPRRSSQDLSTNNASSKMFENPNAKVLLFEDEGTLVPLGHKNRMALKSAGQSRSRAAEGLHGGSNMRTPKKGTVAWASDPDIVSAVYLISAANIYSI